MKTIVLLTGSELRHQFLKIFLGQSKTFRLLKTYAESHDNNLVAQVAQQDDNTLRNTHLELRNQTEKDFFELYCIHTDDLSNTTSLPKGAINLPEYVNEIKALNPDLIVAYGCSIIKSALLEDFKNRFLNVHLGLSPYYRGSGTNYWPLVNGEPELVGVTFMHIDPGVDTGNVIHQIRPRIYPGDDVHKIGNRLICDFAVLLPKIIERFEHLAAMDQLRDASNGKYYKNKDFTEDSLARLYKNFSNGMVSRYLGDKNNRDAQYPIVQNPML